MKLLLVNGNTTQAVTDLVVAEATRCAAPGTAITGVTARFGVTIVSTEAEEEIAGHAVLDALAAHFAGHDAAIWRSPSIRRCWVRGRLFRSRWSASPKPAY